jgi:hypothetical protein
VARLALTPVICTGTSALTLASSGTPLTGNTGVSFVNNGLMFLVIYTGASGAGNVTQNFGRTVEGSAPAAKVQAIANSTNYILGPWSPSDFTAQDGTGNTYIDFSVVTGNSVTLYELVPVT